MTTESTQDTRRGVSPLLGAAVASLGVVALAALAGALVDGPAGAAGAGLGGLLAVVVFAFGLVTVSVVASAMPSASLPVALLTYALQLVVLVAVMARLDAAPGIGDDLSQGWFAGAVIAVTLVWVAAQTVVSTRLRIPAYDLPPTPRPGGER